MNNLKDLIFRYCILFGKRFSYKEKIAFLRIISKQLLQLGYYVDAKIAKLKLARKRYENYYNAYIGDLNQADIIVCTYYDTGINYFNLSKTNAFQQIFSKTRYLIGVLPIITLFLLAILLSYFLFIPNIQQIGLLSVSGLLFVSMILVSSYLIIKYRHGIPNSKNFVCNTSSILVMLNTIDKINQRDKKMKEKVAFVLYDGGCTNQFGLKMLENYSDSIRKKQIIFLDSLGNGETLHFFKPNDVDYPQNDMTFYPGNMPTTFKRYLMIAAGKLTDDQQIEIKNSHSGKDNHLSEALIEQHADSLYDLLVNLIKHPLKKK
ncbi:hypothetical protein PT273_03560 [Orbaceae bacterium ESL0727]|nr:hypothetical protein [Orbaceae bacterium ESL0727]